MEGEGEGEETKRNTVALSVRLIIVFVSFSLISSKRIRGREEGGGRRIHNRALRTQHTCMQSGRPVEHYPHKQTDRQADLLDEQTALTYLRVAAGNLPAGTTQLNLRSEPLDY